jgi:hypothetical protein
LAIDQRLRATGTSAPNVRGAGARRWCPLVVLVLSMAGCSRGWFAFSGVSLGAYERSTPTQLSPEGLDAEYVLTDEYGLFRFGAGAEITDDGDVNPYATIGFDLLGPFTLLGKADSEIQAPMPTVTGVVGLATWRDASTTEAALVYGIRAGFMYRIGYPNVSKTVSLDYAWMTLRRQDGTEERHTGLSATFSWR